jgi:acetyltransferase-like isoleucine patch superfamily enzyme
MFIEKFIDKARKKEGRFYAFLHKLYKNTLNVNVPFPKAVGSSFYYLRLFSHLAWYWLTNKFYYEPMLRARCTRVGENVKCDGDIPLIEGNGNIEIGDNVFIGNKGAWFVSTNVMGKSKLIVGNNTVINYKVQIDVESCVKIGNNCLIAGESKITDNNNHGIHYKNRDMTAEDVSPITIDDHAWIGMNSIILKGVTIGKGAVVAAGSVVTKDVPEMTLVGGNPAKVIKKIDD